MIQILLELIDSNISHGEIELTDSNISHNEFVLINKVLEEYDKVKEEIKN